jgi:hypothetical protein
MSLKSPAPDVERLQVIWLVYALRHGRSKKIGCDLPSAPKIVVNFIQTHLCYERMFSVRLLRMASSVIAVVAAPHAH